MIRLEPHPLLSGISAMSLILKGLKKTDKSITEDPVAIPLGLAVTVALVTLPASLPYIGVVAGAAAIYEGGYWTYRGLSWLLKKNPNKPQRLPPPLPVQPPPVTREQILQDAEKAYREECQVLNGLPLDEEEKKVVLESAKMRYLARVQQLMS